MRIAKEFRWEMGHRLTFHDGKCKNLHGHSYKMMVEFDGEPDKNGMVVDYYEVKKIVEPIVDELDHSFVVYDKDTELIEILLKLKSQMIIIPFESTAENLCQYFLKKIAEMKLPKNVFGIKVRIFETENTYAEEELKINQ